MEKNKVYVDADLEDIVPMFLKNREEDIGKLKKAIEEKDISTLEFLGHNLKGAGSGYGFHKVSEIGLALEEAAQKEDYTLMKRLVEELEIYMSSVEIIYQ